jgi:hypothetical protein
VTTQNEKPNKPRTKCRVRDGRFVEPCDILAKAVDVYAPGFSRAKGIFEQTYTNMETGEPSRTFYGVRTKEFPNGLLFNLCPWCGERISAPFTASDE